MKVKRALSENAVTWLILIAGAVLVVYGLHKHGVLGPSRERLHFGARLDAARVVGDGGETLTLAPGHWTVLLSGPPEDLELAQYLSYLVETSRERSDRLEPLVLIDAAPEKLREFEERNHLAFPLHALGRFLPQDLATLGLTGHRRSYALISPSLRVAFSSTYLRPNDLRLLLEKHLGIARASENAPLEPGDAFPVLELSQVAGPAAGSVDEGGRRAWVVFTSQCVSCSLRNQVGALAGDQALLESYYADRGEALGVIFSNSFDRSDLVAKLRDVGLDAVPVYRSEEPIPGLESAYLRSSLESEDVVVAELSEGGDVVRIDGLWAALRAAEERASRHPKARHE